MVSVLTSSAVDRGFECLSGQTKYYEIGICCFSTKLAALRSKSKNWLARNQNNVSEWGDMFICGLLFSVSSFGFPFMTTTTPNLDVHDIW